MFTQYNNETPNPKKIQIPPINGTCPLCFFRELGQSTNLILYETGLRIITNINVTKKLTKKVIAIFLKSKN